MEKPEIAMEVNRMETTMNNIHPDTTTPAAEAPQPNAASRPGRRAGRPGDDVVRWAEFRQVQWMMGIALAVIISSQGLLYSAILDVQGEMGILRADMQTQISDLRVDMQRQIDELRVDMQTQINELRVDMQTQISDLRVDMQTQFSELRERIVRIEIHLGIDAGSE